MTLAALSVLVVVRVQADGVKPHVVVVSTVSWYVNAIEFEIVQDYAVRILLVLIYKMATEVTKHGGRATVTDTLH